jgi:5-oxoprolinase (ATP-hydrolysing) subunit A
VRVLINADVGESVGAEETGSDKELIPLVDMANIACGFHAGDPVVMHRTLIWANLSGARMGAHVSYPDRKGFGRRSMNMAPLELRACIHEQIAVLQGIAECQDLTVGYVKPHGALYNDMMRDTDIFNVVLEAIARYELHPLDFVLQSTPDWNGHRDQCLAQGVKPLFEVFADRAYDDSGLLVSRDRPEACLDRPAAVEQVKTLIHDSCVITTSGAKLSVPMDTVCVHGDNPEAVALARDIRELIEAT